MSGGMKSFVVCVLLAFCFCVELTAAKKLIVVLVDGVRWDYIKDPELKGIHQIIENGVKAPYVVPIFPTVSYPNWYTLVTGLYAENHGFIANHMYDNETNTFFNMIPSQGATDPHWWNEAEPLWVTAEKNNKISALYWWGGCEVEIRNTHPTICERQLYDGPPTPEGKMDFLERIDDMLEMFKPSKRFPIDRLSLALLYYVSVDYEGHHWGPNSKNSKSAMRDIDEMLEKMQSKIKKAGLKDEINIMVVSDHGMTDVRNTTTKYIALEKYASKIKYQFEFGGFSMIVPQPEMLDKLASEIQSEEGLQVYKKENIPEKYHIKNNRKTPSILLVAKKGYFIKSLNQPQLFAGHHGHDPEEVEDMRTVFFATGPDFRKGVETEVLYTTDLYNVMCSVLEIDPQPNNGSWDRVQSMLVAGTQKPTPKTDFINSASSQNHALISVAITLSMLYLLTRFM